MFKIFLFFLVSLITLNTSSGYDFEYESYNRNDQYSTSMIIGNDGRISNNVICHYVDGNNYIIKFNNPELNTYFRLVQDTYYTNCYYLETKEEWSCCIHHNSFHTFDLGLYRYTWVNDDNYYPNPTPNYTPEYTPYVTYTPNYTPEYTPYVTETPTTEPTIEPTVDPTIEPTIEPTVEPTIEPTVDPTVEPTIEPTVEPPSCGFIECSWGYTFSYDTCMCEQSVNNCPETTCSFGTTFDSNTCSCVGDGSGSNGGSGYNNYDGSIENNSNNQNLMRNLEDKRQLPLVEELIIQRNYYAGIHCNGYPTQSCECCGLDSQCTNTYYNYRELQFLRQTRKLSMSCVCPTDINTSNGNGIFWSTINQEYIRQTITTISCPSPTPSPSSYVHNLGDCTYAYLGYFQINLTPKSHGPFRMAVKLWSPLQGEYIIHIFNLDANTLINYVIKKYIYLFQIGNELHYKTDYNGPTIYKSRISDYIYIYFLGDGQGLHYWDFFADTKFYYLINPAIYGYTTYQGANYQLLFNDLFYVINCVSPSASPSSSSSPTPSRSATPSITPSSTPSITPSRSSTPSITPSSTPSPTPSITPTSTPTISITASTSITPSITPSPSCVWSALSCDPTGQFCTVKNVQNPCVTPTPITQPSQIAGIKIIRIRAPKTMRVF
jgi:hypothetical protein